MKKSKRKFPKLLVMTALMFIFTQWGWAKRVQVTFHEVKDNLIIALDENQDGFKEFYVVKLLAPINKKLFVDDKYKVDVKKGVLVLVGKKHTLVLTVDKKIIQTAFKQRGTYYILVNGIASGKAIERIRVKELLESDLIEKVFEEGEASNGRITLERIAVSPLYKENRQFFMEEYLEKA
ncbi:MAG: hypothetical protein GXO27_02050 [Chlorobi bacterium]|nr:hypothetical protein [Chlorobiota bacterium]